ncbi:MAG: YbbR-like domain-containing protein [Bacteroidetes bacterium]|nr:YbbR-like domain-containing protein [Flavobacteriales bacterium]NOG57180.1 YbbR-like domain-containing protein [Bacteroidota bacterium]
MFESFKKLFLESKEGKIKLNQKAIIFFFCLLLSTFFWFLSSLSKNYTTDLSFPVKYTGYSENFILIEAPSSTITGRVFGSGYELLGEQFSLNRSSIEIDLNSARPGKSRNTYYIETKRQRDKLIEKLDKDIQLQFLRPDTLYFKTQARTSKIVHVIPKLNYEFEAGFQLRGDLIVNPKKIKVSGPKSYIDTLKQVYTEIKHVKDLKDSTQVNLKLIKDQTINGLQFEKEQVDILIPVEKYTEKEISLDINVNASSHLMLRVFPAKVNVKVLVPMSLYENLDETLLMASVKYVESRDKGAEKLQVNLKGIPKYAKLIRIEPERVEYIIRK